MHTLPDCAVRLPGVEWPLSLVGTDPTGRERDYRHAASPRDLRRLRTQARRDGWTSLRTRVNW